MIYRDEIIRHYNSNFKVIGFEVSFDTYEEDLDDESEPNI
jgi:hypothetical protein